MAAALAGAAVCAYASAPAHAGICGQGTYAYAGFTGHTVTRGVSATIAQAGPLAVRSGHVAGWIGIVDPISSGWLQAGLSALPGQATSAIYLEFHVPGRRPIYRRLGRGVEVDEPHTFMIAEQLRSPGTWVVRVDGRPAGPPVHLRDSHNRWTAQVLGESWAGDRSGPCNAYSYAFSNVRLMGRHGVGGLDRLAADPNYAVANPTSSSFVTTNFGLAQLRGAEIETPGSPPAGTHTQ